MSYSVILFESNNHAMWCKQALTENKLETKLINVPRDLSSDCGYCIRILSSDSTVAKSIMNDSQIEYQDIVEI